MQKNFRTEKGRAGKGETGNWQKQCQPCIPNSYLTLFFVFLHFVEKVTPAAK
jgi:hypothetical protein